MPSSATGSIERLRRHNRRREVNLVGGTGIKNAHLISFDKLYVLDEFKLDDAAFGAISDPEQHKAAVKAAMDKITDAGDVGLRLATFARASQELDLVCWPGVPGEFLCPEEAAKAGRQLDGPTIMWDPYETFAYFGTTEGQYTGKDEGKVAADTPSVKDRIQSLQTGGLKVEAKKGSKETVYKAQLMPAWVVLAHEIGHYYHYVHQTAWFIRCLDGGDIAGIERRNLGDHESPILKHIGLAPRANYQDFKGGSNDNPDKHIQWGGLPHGDPNLCASIGPDLRHSKQVFDALLQAAQRKKVAKDSAKKVTTKVTRGAQTCEFCGKSFTSGLLLKVHLSDCELAPK
jgi:hypothetical protein